MAALSKGTKVRQVAPAIEGEVVDRRLNQDHGCVEYEVEYVGGDAETHKRWFLETELEVA